MRAEIHKKKKRAGENFDHEGREAHEESQKKKGFNHGFHRWHGFFS